MRLGSVVVDIIDISRVTVFESKHHPPVRPHRYRPKTCIFPLEGMKPKPRQVHVLRMRGGVEAHQDISYNLPVLGKDTTCIAAFVNSL